MLGQLPLQQRRTETLEGEHFSYNFAAVEGSKRPNLFWSTNRFFDPSAASFWRSNGFRPKTLLLLRNGPPPTEFL